ncbi:MAG: hypothetical protein RL385_3876 [Pseudomonadota bacterium]
MIPSARAHAYRSAFHLFAGILFGCGGIVDAPAGALGPTANEPLGEGTVASAQSPAGSNGTAARAALVGRTGPRRLTNTEYNRTVQDLLSTKLSPAASFVAEEAEGFDTVASAMGMTPSQYESYVNAAEGLSAELFADAERMRDFLPCAPGGADGKSCVVRVLNGFSERAYRRPPDSEESARILSLYDSARALGETELASLQQVVTAVLVSPRFLYRTELAPVDVGTALMRPLDGYELASRLSYFLWSSMPDAALFAKAADGSLLNTDVLTFELARMLDDPRAESLVDNFAAQWLGFRELAQHRVLSERYPSFNDALRDSMLREARAYVRAFFFDGVPLSDFLRSDLHFVDAALASLYQVPAPKGTGLTRMDTPIGDRRGYLGLAAFLTLSSFAQRTSPTLRAKWVLEELLCSPVPPPPANVKADLEGDAAANAAAAIENVRKRLELHRSDPGCAGCHAGLDPIGLALESFDAIGRSRSTYENGDPVDTLGSLPDGTSFDGPLELADVLSNDARFVPCATHKLVTYALGRNLQEDADLVDSLVASLPPAASFRTVVEALVLSPSFRSERSEGSKP